MRCNPLQSVAIPANARQRCSSDCNRWKRIKPLPSICPSVTIIPIGTRPNAKRPGAEAPVPLAPGPVIASVPVSLSLSLSTSGLSRIIAFGITRTRGGLELKGKQFSFHSSYLITWYTTITLSSLFLFAWQSCYRAFLTELRHRLLHLHHICCTQCEGKRVSC